MEFLCSPALFSLQTLRRRSNGDCFSITVVIRLIGHGVGFLSQKFPKAGSPTLGEHGRRIPVETMLQSLQLHGKMCRGRES